MGLNNALCPLYTWSSIYCIYWDHVKFFLNAWIFPRRKWCVNTINHTDIISSAVIPSMYISWISIFLPSTVVIVYFTTLAKTLHIYPFDSLSFPFTILITRVIIRRIYIRAFSKWFCSIMGRITRINLRRFISIFSSTTMKNQEDTYISTFSKCFCSMTGINQENL